MKAKNSSKQERLAAALRENLKRRKARDRAVAATPKTQSETAVEPRPNTAPKPD
jgi:hypothetical protein